MSENDTKIRELYRRSGGKAWEPPNVHHPLITQLIKDGYLKRCVMRCGFEAFDSGVEWTTAAHSALGATQP